MMEITGTIQGPDGATERIAAQGTTYDAAKEALYARIPEGHQLIAIRTF